MFIARIFRNLRTPSVEVLIDQTRTLVHKLHHEQSAQDALQRVEDYALGIEGRDRWEAWRWLIRKYRETDVELRYLDKCHRNVWLAKRMELDDEDQKNFLGCFSTFATDLASLDQLSRAIDTRKKLWNRLRAKVRQVRPNVFVTHSFLMLSESSSVESGSLIVGGLIFFGAVYMNYFYIAAVGETVQAYWTLDDLINHGILVLKQVMVAILALEILFLFWRWLISMISHKYAYTPHWFVLKHPLWLVVSSFAILTLVASTWGTYAGAAKLSEFQSMTPNNTELATVSDGTVLRNVFLVGTTSRTATFLQVENWGAPVLGADGELIDCRSNATVDQDGEVDPISDACVADPSRVLIMDRALIVCHAKDEICIRQERMITSSLQAPDPDNGGADTAIVDLEAQLDDVETQVGELTGTIEALTGSNDLTAEFRTMRTEIDLHLNRHLNLIDARIDRLDEDWGEVVGNGAR